MFISLCDFCVNCQTQVHLQGKEMFLREISVVVFASKVPGE